MRLVYVLLVCLSIFGCNSNIYKYSSTYCDETKDIYLLENRKQMLVYEPYLKSEFEAAHLRLPAKTLSNIKFDEDSIGKLTYYQMPPVDSSDIPVKMYLSCLILNNSFSILEDTSILRSLFTERKLIFSSIRDTSFFIGNRGYIHANSFEFYTDSLINNKIYGFGKVVFVENKPLYFCYTLNGIKRSSSADFKCVAISHRKKSNLKAISAKLL